MNAANLQRQLDAGGLIFVNSEDDSKLTESIVARTYGAKVLGDRPVICLSSDRLLPAEDLAMEYLGLEGRDTSPPLARQNRTALDFAHWALIKQPQDARYALDLVKRMKAAARRASAKPGHAWEMYQEMADELNKSVRHFLPPFWEQAARSFKEIGNTTYAGRALNKALEAERVHALEVDREHRRDAVLEFSLSGCLSGKALTDYSKDLSNQFEPAEAYETYKDLVIRRTLGGMPPTGNTASDLVRMAKAAQLDVDEEIESVLEAIITSPSMSRAPMQFWKSVKKQVARIVARSDTFAMWLLAHTDPQSRYTDDSIVWQWLDLLDHWKVLPLLSRPADQLPAEVEIPGGRAGWISRIASVEESPHKRVFELLEQMADVLRDEGQPIDLAPGHSWRSFIDVDVLEACLQLGLAVEDPRENAKLSFDGWLREEVDHPRRNSQLLSVTQDPRYAARLRDGIPELIQFRGEDRVNRPTWGRTVAPRRSFEEAAANHPAVREAWWAYLDQQLQALESGGLVDFEDAVEKLRACAGEKTAAEFPDFLPRLRGVDTVSCLQRTLAAGVFDEYGWEALDKVADEHPIPTSSRHDEVVHWAFPHCAFLSDNRVHVVGPKGPAGIHEIDLKGKQLQALLPVGDDLVAAYRDKSWKTYIRWLSDPKTEHEQSQYFYSWGVDAILQVGEQSWFYGGRVVHPGDAKLPNPSAWWFSDGKRYWRVKEHAQYAWREAEESEEPGTAPLYEIDPETGEHLRDSVPAFFESDLPAGARVAWRLSYLLPLADAVGDSPLGTRDGLIGWRVVRRRDGAVEGVGIDGRRVVFEPDVQTSDGILAARGLMDKPAASGWWILTNDGRLMDSNTQIAIARVTDGRTKYFAGQPAELPDLFFHLMRVRSLSSSKQLRGTGAEEAKQLVEAGRIEHDALKEKEDPGRPDPRRTAAETAVAKWLTEAPPRLVRGVARLARAAAEEQISLANLIKGCEPAAPASTGGALPGSNTTDAGAAAQGLIQLSLPRLPGAHYYQHESDNPQNAAHLHAVGAFFAGQTCEGLPRCDLYWFELLRDPAGIAWNCFWKTITNEEMGASVASRLQSPWLDAMQWFADSKLLGLPGSFKLYHSKDMSDAESYKVHREGLSNAHPVAFEEGKSRYVAYEFDGYPLSHFFVLEYAAGGNHQPPKSLLVTETLDVQPTWKANDVARFIDAVRKIESLPLPTAEELDTASQLLGLHPVAIALSYMGDLRTTRYGQEKLTKELRQHYGWKVKDIQLALSELEGADRPERVGAMYLRHEPAGVLEEHRERAFQRMVESWKEKRRDVLPIPGDVVKDLEHAAGGYSRFAVKRFAEMLTDPAHAEEWQPSRVRFVVPKMHGHDLLQFEYTPKTVVSPDVLLPPLVKAIALINYRLPVADPLRLRIPPLVDVVEEFLEAPETQLPFGKRHTQLGTDADIDATVANFAAYIGGLERGEDGVYRGENELMAVALLPPQVCMLFRPAALHDRSVLDRLRAAASLTLDYDGPGDNSLRLAELVLKLRSEAFTSLVEANRQPVAPQGSWEQDPRISVPGIVDEAAKHLGVSHDAATLYLQLLALADPSDKNIRGWNTWSPKQHKQAAEELVNREHVVAAKRARAGRGIFLPGGWEPLGSPNLPIESWKLPLFDYSSTEALRGRYAELILCKRSIGRHFEVAWKRVQDGDPPQYEEADSKRRRK